MYVIFVVTFEFVLAVFHYLIFPILLMAYHNIPFVVLKMLLNSNQPTNCMLHA